MALRWIKHDENGARLVGDFALQQDGPGEWAEDESIPLPIPTVVTAAQGGIALIRAGLMEAVLAAANDAETPAEVRWAFQSAQEWNRSSFAFNYLADKASISEETRKQLFADAAAITV